MPRTPMLDPERDLMGVHPDLGRDRRSDHADDAGVMVLYRRPPSQGG